MKLYQSMTHTQPSGPTSAMIGAVHSIVARQQVRGTRGMEIGPVGRQDEHADQVARRFAHECGAIPIFLGIGAGRVECVPGSGRVTAVMVDLPHLVGDRLEAIAVGDR